MAEFQINNNLDTIKFDLGVITRQMNIDSIPKSPEINQKLKKLNDSLTELLEECNSSNDS